MNDKKCKPWIQLLRLDKPIGIFLLLWPTWWALWIASQGHPDIKIVGIFTLGVVVMRSAGCIMNDIADRHLDGGVERTKDRPLPAKKITTKAALLVFALLMLLALVLVLQLNRLTVFFAFFGALFAIIYPFLKRITHLPQVGLGIAFSWGIPMAFAATLNTVSWQSGLLFLTAMLWPIIYDTQYAMTDRQDDLKMGIKSTAILWGDWDKKIIGMLQLIFLGLLVMVGYAFQLQWAYFLSVSIAGLFFIYQQYLLKDRKPYACFQAFLNNQWVGLVIFVGILSSYL